MVLRQYRAHVRVCVHIARHTAKYLPSMTRGNQVFFTQAGRCAPAHGGKASRFSLGDIGGELATRAPFSVGGLWGVLRPEGQCLPEVSHSQHETPPWPEQAPLPVAFDAAPSRQVAPTR